MARFVSVEQAAAWLGGMFDGEGTIAVYRPARYPGKNRVVRLFNTDPSIMDAAEEACVMLGLRFKRYSYTPQPFETRSGTRARRPIETIEVRGRESFEIMRDMVPIMADHKRAALAEICEYRRQVG